MGLIRFHFQRKLRDAPLLPYLSAEYPSKAAKSASADPVVVKKPVVADLQFSRRILIVCRPFNFIANRYHCTHECTCSTDPHVQQVFSFYVIIPLSLPVTLVGV